LQFIVVASDVSSFVERKIRWYCSVVYVMGNFKNFNHITSQVSIFYMRGPRINNDRTAPDFRYCWTFLSRGSVFSQQALTTLWLKKDTILLSVTSQMLTYFQNSFTVRLCRKFVMKSYLNIPHHTLNMPLHYDLCLKKSPCSRRPNWSLLSFKIFVL